MHFKSILTLGFIFCAAQPLYAQDVVIPDVYTEVMLKNLCTDADASSALEKCSKWVATSTCSMVYDEELPNVEKFFSHEQMQKFRISGEKQLPNNCELIAKLKLGMEILDKDLKLNTPQLSPNERLSRWKNIVKQSMPKSKGNSLAPEQYKLIIEPMMDSPDFEALKKDKDVVAFIKVVLNEYVKQIPNLKSAAQSNKKQIELLRQIETVFPDLITPEVSLVLLAIEIQNKQYKAAEERMEHLDVSKLNQSQRDSILPLIADAAVSIWGNLKFQNNRCFKETAPKGNQAHILNYLFNQTNHPAISTILRAQMALWLKNCDEDKLANQLTKVWNVQYKNDAIVKLMDDFMTWVENDANPSLILIMLKYEGNMDPAAQKKFSERYGKRLAKWIMPLVRYDLDNGKADKAAEWIKPLLQLVPEADKCEVQLLYGRCLEMQKNVVSARQQWAQIIDTQPNGVCKQSAYTLSIQSFRKAGMKQDADALEERLQGRQ